MNGQKRAPGVPFKSGHEVLLMFLGDPATPASEIARCRRKRIALVKAAA